MILLSGKLPVGELLTTILLGLGGGCAGALLARRLNRLLNKPETPTVRVSPVKPFHQGMQLKSGETTQVPIPVPPAIKAKLDAGASLDILQGPMEPDGDGFRQTLSIVVDGKIEGYTYLHFAKSKRPER
jgi:hypothetical protein